MRNIMIKITGCLILASMLLAATASSAAKSERDVLYQVSTIDSLMAGLYDGRMSLGKLAKHGDFGLGTFDKLDGEMIVLDGIIYQVTSDGVAHTIAGGTTTPFAAVTFFDKDKTAAIGREKSLTELKDYLDRMLPLKNLFYAIRIDGAFKHVKTRSVPAQRKPYKKLVEVAAQQPVFEFNEVQGTIVALRCPYYVKGVNVPEYHFHFITADRKQGGHLLDCTIQSGLVMLDLTPEFNLFLPRDDAFYHMDFEQAVQDDLKKVE